jgi:hypothetical protein
MVPIQIQFFSKLMSYYVKRNIEIITEWNTLRARFSGDEKKMHTPIC